LMLRTSMGRDLPIVLLSTFMLTMMAFPATRSTPLSRGESRTVARSGCMYATPPLPAGPISRQILGRDPSQHDSEVLRRVGLD
jgi:hypothetical protein